MTIFKELFGIVLGATTGFRAHVNDERFIMTDGNGRSNNPQLRHEAVLLVRVAFHSKRHNTAKPFAFELTTGQFVLRMGRQTRVVNVGNAVI
ncbi:hypothetical protein D3C80_1868060 [compost metagenome]